MQACHSECEDLSDILPSCASAQTHQPLGLFSFISMMLNPPGPLELCQICLATIKLLLLLRWPVRVAMAVGGAVAAVVAKGSAAAGYPYCIVM